MRCCPRCFLQWRATLRRAGVLDHLRDALRSHLPWARRRRVVCGKDLRSHGQLRCGALDRPGDGGAHTRPPLVRRASTRESGARRTVSGAVSGQPSAISPQKKPGRRTGFGDPISSAPRLPAPDFRRATALCLLPAASCQRLYLVRLLRQPIRRILNHRLGVLHVDDAPDHQAAIQLASTRRARSCRAGMEG